MYCVPVIARSQVQWAAKVTTHDSVRNARNDVSTFAAHYRYTISYAMYNIRHKSGRFMKKTEIDRRDRKLSSHTSKSTLKCQISKFTTGKKML